LTQHLALPFIAASQAQKHFIEDEGVLLAWNGSD
jgi:hypothetical protein